ncbi:trypsin-like peptidase domain-containing protein, partial [Marivita sp.]|uniref:trypsin-like peptidase domain-containing protein n=1 Tax=Marivita sp. TaxID=2003365 RepID=UPI0025C2997A
GTSTYLDGSKYVGQWKDDKWHGQGTVTYPDGGKYTGQWKDHKRHGQGTEIYPEGGEYIGKWKDDKWHGQGTVTYPNGQKWIGEVMEHELRGWRYVIFPNGQSNYCYQIDFRSYRDCSGTNIHNVAPALKSAFVNLSDQRRKAVQQRLKISGLYESTIDGLWGRNTFAAILSYAAMNFEDIDVRTSTSASEILEAVLRGAFITSKPDPEPVRPDDNQTYKVASGTGFYVSREGHVITNSHVIDGCKEIKIHSKGNFLDTVIVASDPQNDLALLKSDGPPAAFFSLSQNNPYPLQDVIVAGFPFGDRVSSSLKFTRGIVSSLTGIGNNYSEIQIDAALQPGNSGGPILDEFGNVIAVAVAKLDMKKILNDYGVIPENTNFGIKSSAVRNLMEGNRLVPKESSKKMLTRLELSQLATDATVFLTCWMTTAQIDQLKSRKVMFTQFE